MNKWIAEFDLEDGDKMPEHMDLNYMGGKIDFHCRPMWIPCSERLPEESGNYIVSGVWTSGKKAVGECEYSTDDGYFQASWSFTVVAWMPMPEPYQEGKK